MPSDTMPILEEEYETSLVTSSKTKNKKRDGFNDVMMQKLGRAQIFVGIASILVGILLEIFGSMIVCEIYCYGVPISMIGTGIWSGLIFIAIGVLGIFAARRKTTCFIVAVMAVNFSFMALAALQTGLGVAAMIQDRNKIRIEIPTRSSSQYESWRNQYEQLRTIPIPLFILNLVLAVLGLIMLGLLITTAIYSCVATCCHPNPNYLRINLYEPVSMHQSAYAPPMQMPVQMQSHPYMMPGQGQMYYSPQNFGGNVQGGMQPIILMPSHHQVGYQGVAQPSGYPYQMYQPNPAGQQVTKESVQTDTQEAAEVPVQQM